MEISEEKKECVKVAVNVRPLITSELLMGCTDCVTVVPGEPQVQIGSHAFTYDHVYGSSGAASSSIFEECVLPLVEALFRGYNATVLAYGQTGSGKTYTMGTNYNGDGNTGGIIPQVMETIFKRVDEMKEATEFLIRVSFIEIFKEEVYDLLDPHPMRADAKSTTIARTPIQIRETMSGGITLAGVTEAEVRSKDEMASYLARGSLSRATGSTNMNSQSSRSHAIFTICLEQKKMIANSSVNTEVGDDILVAKLHLVDLAGSERAKRTGADGLRFKEGIHINRGLLALGNVISALGDEKKRKEGGHVPYRDSKLTRLLQDSLGGNSKTVMIACVSPADLNAEETINTLKYANRARNIQNKAVVNRDPVAAEMQRMRSQLEQLQAELLFSRGGNASLEELQILRHRNSLLEARNAELHQELKERQITCELFKKSALDAQVEKENLVLKMESARGGKPWDGIDKMDKDQDLDILRGYISKIQELEAELLRAQHFSSLSRNNFMDHLSVEHVTPSCDDMNIDIPSEAEDEKEREHSSLRNQLDKELQELDQCLEQKEEEMKQFAMPDTSVLKQHYEKKLLELEQEKKLLLKEIEDLRSKYLNVSSTSGESAEKLKADYLQKLNMLEAQVTELKKKQEAQAQLLKQKQKSDEAAKRLQEEIQRIKSQKVQLQHKIKQESEQFRAWKASREKEVMQLKKEGRRNEYEMHKLLALNQRQKMVLQRKSEEAALATKRLKEVLEAKKSRELTGHGNINNAGIQALIQAVEHELEVTLRVHEVRSAYERQMQERIDMANEMSRLKEESDMLKQKTMMECPRTMSPSARSSRISALENMLKASSNTLVAMASQLSEAEERERVFNGRGRWNQVRSLADAKNIMNYLFNMASSSRCQLRDIELSCREKDTVISELKEKIVMLNSLVRQLEIQLQTKMKEQENEGLKSLPMRNSRKDSNRTSLHFGNNISKDPDNSQFMNQSVKYLEDMDISDSEIYDMSDNDDTEKSDDEDWIESGKKRANMHRKTGPARRLTTVTKNLITDGLSEERNPVDEKLPGHCCTCSRYSLCKTKKCECFAAGDTCSASCQCASSRCTNRDNGVILNNCKDESNMEANESGGRSHWPSDMRDHEGSTLVSQGTLLLQSALSEKIDQENSDAQPRKALSDIGNTLKTSKANQRKKWRKSTIQLVPTAPLPPAIPESKEPSRNIEDTTLKLPRAMDTTLKLPRAMDSTSSANNPPLSDMNSIRHDESTNKKEVRGVLPQRSPVKIWKASDEKENNMR